VVFLHGNPLLTEFVFGERVEFCTFAPAELSVAVATTQCRGLTLSQLSYRQKH
jgi:hypothetical protein